MTTYLMISCDNNASYVDGFFSFLSGQLINKHKFIHGIEFYGSFLAIKNNFKLNIFDDLDYLCKSPFFNENKNISFQVEDYSYILSQQDNNKKSLPPLIIDHSITNKSNISIHSINENLFDDVFISDDSTTKNKEEQNNKHHITLNDLKDNSIELLDITNSTEYFSLMDNKITTIKSSSTCSSRTSYTCENDEKPDYNKDKKDEKDEKYEDCHENVEHADDDDYENDGDDEDDDEDDDEEEVVEATIPTFPINIVCMEYCEDTFDNLIMDNEDLPEEEWFSAFMQIIMILITYQKCFSFTHNDLHTNNIMYNKTDKKYTTQHNITQHNIT